MRILRILRNVVLENISNEKKRNSAKFFFNKDQTKSLKKSKKFQLPSIDLLEKNNSKLSPQE